MSASNSSGSDQPATACDVTARASNGNSSHLPPSLPNNGISYTHPEASTRQGSESRPRNTEQHTALPQRQQQHRHQQDRDKQGAQHQRQQTLEQAQEQEQGQGQGQEQEQGQGQGQGQGQPQPNGAQPRSHQHETTRTSLTAVTTSPRLNQSQVLSRSISSSPGSSSPFPDASGITPRRRRRSSRASTPSSSASASSSPSSSSSSSSSASTTSSGFTSAASSGIASPVPRTQQQQRQRTTPCGEAQTASASVRRVPPVQSQIDAAPALASSATRSSTSPETEPRRAAYARLRAETGAAVMPPQGQPPHLTKRAVGRKTTSDDGCVSAGVAREAAGVGHDDNDHDSINSSGCGVGKSRCKDEGMCTMDSEQPGGKVARTTHAKRGGRGARAEGSHRAHGSNATAQAAGKMSFATTTLGTKEVECQKKRKTRKPNRKKLGAEKPDRVHVPRVRKEMGKPSAGAAGGKGRGDDVVVFPVRSKQEQLPLREPPPPPRPVSLKPSSSLGTSRVFPAVDCAESSPVHLIAQTPRHGQQPQSQRLQQTPQQQQKQAPPPRQRQPPPAFAPASAPAWQAAPFAMSQSLPAALAYGGMGMTPSFVPYPMWQAPQQYPSYPQTPEHQQHQQQQQQQQHQQQQQQQQHQQQQQQQQQQQHQQQQQQQQQQLLFPSQQLHQQPLPGMPDQPLPDGAPNQQRIGMVPASTAAFTPGVSQVASMPMMLQPSTSHSMMAMPAYWGPGAGLPSNGPPSSLSAQHMANPYLYLQYLHQHQQPLFQQQGQRHPPTLNQPQTSYQQQLSQLAGLSTPRQPITVKPVLSPQGSQSIPPAGGFVDGTHSVGTESASITTPVLPDKPRPKRAGAPRRQEPHGREKQKPAHENGPAHDIAATGQQPMKRAKRTLPTRSSSDAMLQNDVLARLKPDACARDYTNPMNDEESRRCICCPDIARKTSDISSTRKLCGVCYSGFYHDIMRWISHFSRDPNTVTIEQLVDDFCALPRGCRFGLRCLQDYREQGRPVKCTRCRSVYLCLYAPRFAFAMFQRLCFKKMNGF